MIDRFASVVMLGSVVVAESRLSKRPLKVVVYTPLVTVAALPEISPAIGLVNVCVPPHVLLVVVPNAEVNTPVEELYASGYVAESDEEEILLLKVVKSADERYPLAPVVACAIERTFPVNERGAVAEVMREVYAVFQSVVEAVSGMVYPAVSEKAPVPLVYVRPVAEEESAARARASV